MNRRNNHAAVARARAVSAQLRRMRTSAAHIRPVAIGFTHLTVLRSQPVRFGVAAPTL